MNFLDKYENFIDFLSQEYYYKYNDVLIKLGINEYNKSTVNILNKNRTVIKSKESYKNNIVLMAYYVLYNIIRGKHIFIISDIWIDKSHIFKYIMDIMVMYSKKYNIKLRYENVIGSKLYFQDYGNVRIIAPNEIEESYIYQNDITISYYKGNSYCDIFNEFINDRNCYIIKDKSLTTFYNCIQTDLSDTNLRKFTLLLEGIKYSENIFEDFYELENIVKDIIEREGY